MLLRWLIVLSVIGVSIVALAQSPPMNPPMVYGMVPTVGQWNAWFEQKENAFSTQPGIPLIGNSAGGVTSGNPILNLPASAGSGGLYVCADSTGNLYKKSSCP